MKYETKNKSIYDMCDIFRDENKLTDKEVLNIIVEYHGFESILETFLDDIVCTASNYSNKELKEYVNSIQSLIDYEISKRGK